MNNSLVTRSLTPLAVICALALLGINSLAAAEQAQKPQVIGLMLYSDTCASCQVLDPKIEAAKADFKDQALLFATLDHSNDGSKQQASLLAHALGLGELYKAQEKASGFMLLVNAESGEVLATLTRDMSDEDIKAAFTKALEA
ncbi:MAG: hypothetical protein ACFCU3_08985 [Verrucomicrobiales bacterium]